MKVLITGASGQLGRDCVDAFGDDEVVALDRHHLDVTDEAAVFDMVASVTPDVVVNTAAVTDVDACEDDPERVHRVNALGPWWLARACVTVGARLLTVSSDYVFSGEWLADGRGWNEFDPVAPVNAYGRSKAAGEQLVRETLRDHHIVRTAWLCGARGDNVVTTMLRWAREHGEVAVVDDQVGSPTFARDLAAALRRLVVAGRPGTVHLTNAGQCSWFDLVVAAFEQVGMEASIVATTSAQLGRRAARPAWSVLDGTHAAAIGVGPLPHWREGLVGLLEELGERPAT